MVSEFLSSKYCTIHVHRTSHVNSNVVPVQIVRTGDTKDL